MKTVGRIVGGGAVAGLVWGMMLVLSGATASLGHPGSGIVVDREGRVYFTDTGQGLWRIDEEGRVSAHEGAAYHWMAIDHENRLAVERWPEFVEPSTRIERVGKNPTLLISSDFPLTTGRDGALYYPEFARGGPLRIYKLAGSGQRTVLASLGTGADGRELQWLNGMAAGADGSIYISENAAVRRITGAGVVSTIVQDITLADRRRIPGADERLGPMLRGLDIARDGTIYVAASACCALLKITREGVSTALLQTEPPWSPTGVAVSGDMIYVLEYLHAAGDTRREWLPRVRRISADGSHAIIARIERSGPNDSRAVQVQTSSSGTRRENSFRGTKAGDEIEVGGLKLCWCPPGTFKMGSPASEPNHRPDEEQVEVTLTKGFWMGKYEVTQAQWKRVMGERSDPAQPLNAGAGENFPVYWVSFEQAEEFCRKLTAEVRGAGDLPNGWEFRLPTEAQWEYACRAGTTSAFAFGETLSDRDANFGKPYNGTPTGVPGAAAAPVGSYPANRWGFHEMHGNEFEWCRDWYHARLPGGTDPFRAQPGTPNGDGSFSRVRRGGAWTDRAEFCRSALRLRFEPHRSSDHIGFRVVLEEERLVGRP